jgi:hypothetical protein
MKRFIAFVVLTVISVVLPRIAWAACSPATSGELVDRNWRELEWMHLGKNSIKEKLKDPESARFKDVYFCRNAHDIPMTCGWVNARNSFGGYGGFERFISAGKPEMSHLESEGHGFSTAWNGLCR